MCYTYWIIPYSKVVYELQVEQLVPLVYQKHRKFLELHLEVAMDTQDQSVYEYVCEHGVMAGEIVEILPILMEMENPFFHQNQEWKAMQQVYLKKICLAQNSPMMKML